MDKFNLFNVKENGDKELAGSFDTEQEARDALQPGTEQSIERTNDLGTQVLFSAKRA